MSEKKVKRLLKTSFENLSNLLIWQRTGGKKFPLSGKQITKTNEFMLKEI
jgi:hypothetical protein